MSLRCPARCELRLRCGSRSCVHGLRPRWRTEVAASRVPARLTSYVPETGMGQRKAWMGARPALALACPGACGTRQTVLSLAAPHDLGGLPKPQPRPGKVQVLRGRNKEGCFPKVGRQETSATCTKMIWPQIAKLCYPSGAVKVNKQLGASPIWSRPGPRCWWGSATERQLPRTITRFSTSSKLFARWEQLRDTALLAGGPSRGPSGSSAPSRRRGSRPRRLAWSPLLPWWKTSAAGKRNGNRGVRDVVRVLGSSRGQLNETRDVLVEVGRDDAHHETCVALSRDISAGSRRSIGERGSRNSAG